MLFAGVGYSDIMSMTWSDALVIARASARRRASEYRAQALIIAAAIAGGPAKRTLDDLLAGLEGGG